MLASVLIAGLRPRGGGEPLREGENAAYLRPRYTETKDVMFTRDVWDLAVDESGPIPQGLTRREVTALVLLLLCCTPLWAADYCSNQSPGSGQRWCTGHH